MENKKPQHHDDAEARKIERLNAIRDKHSGDSALDQRSRLLLALRDFPLTTIEARRYLDIMHPGGRVMELRRSDWRIDTLWSWEPTDCGELHRVARYVLQVAS